MKLKPSESIIYGVFIGLGLFPTLVYYLGFVFGLSASIWIVMIGLILGGILFYENNKKK